MPVVRNCDQCGTSFSFAPSLKRKFCSRNCADDYKRAHKIGRKPGPKVVLDCDYCAASFNVKPSVASVKRFCSNQCKYEGLSAEAEARRLEQTHKRCGECGETKPVGDFYEVKRRPGMRMSRCKACHKKACAASYARNRARRAETQRKWTARNRARVARSQLRWRTENAEYKRQSDRARYRANRDRHNRYGAQRRARKRGAAGAHSFKDVIRIWHAQRGECARCEARFGKRPGDRGFHVDHVTPLARGGSDWPRNLQLLCPTCNCRKKDKTPAEFTLYLRRLAGV